MRFPSPITWAILAAATGNALADAVFDPAGQFRTTATSADISGGEGDASDADGDAAIGYGVFNSSITSLAELLVDPPFSGQGLATQDSNIEPTSVTGSGVASALADARFGSAVSGFGESVFSYTFIVTDDTSYTLGGGLDASSATDSFASITLSSVEYGLIHDVLASGATPFDFAGVLAPGHYTLDAIASATAADGSDSDAAFDFVLTPEPASALLLALGALAVRRRR